jgi:hypothetical protein
MIEIDDATEKEFLELLYSIAKYQAEENAKWMDELIEALNKQPG